MIVRQRQLRSFTRFGHGSTFLSFDERERFVIFFKSFNDVVVAVAVDPREAMHKVVFS